MSGTVQWHAEQALARTRFPAVVVEVRTDRIVAASPAAAVVLDPSGKSVVGSLFEDFTADEPMGARELFGSGRVTGFEAMRVLARPGVDLPIRVWLHRFDHHPPSEFILVMLVADEAGSDLGCQPVDRPDTGVVTGVAGTVDESLLVVQLSEATQPLLGVPVEDVLGRSLLSLVVMSDRARVLAGIAEAAQTRRGITLYVDIAVRVTERAATSTGCELLVVPLSPAPSCLFFVLPAGGGLPGSRLSEEVPAILTRMLQGVEPSSTSVRKHAAESALFGIEDLTSREREVLDLLVSGHRVPAIARALFLSQSTVRTYVAAVQNKLGVRGQRRLVEFVNRGPEPGS